jgi:hypothetical protein
MTMKLDNTIVRLQPGMYILRHPKAGLPPISVGRAVGDATSVGRVEVLSTPKTHGTILRDGSDCIVMYVTGAPVDLLVTAYLAKDGGVVPALRVDRIGLDEDGRQQTATPTVATIASSPHTSGGGIEVAASGLTLIGHIELSGDRSAADGQSLGEPASSLRLEGFQVEWPDQPEGVNLKYSVAVEGHGALPQVGVSNFCGTRGQGRRITEVTFVLVGPNAPNFQLEGVANFSGGFHMPVTSGEALSGPSGLEHLVALSLRVVANVKQSVKAANLWEPSPRTRVLKPKRATK